MHVNQLATRARCRTRGASRPATRKATSRHHDASRLKLEAKFQAARSCCKDVRVTPRTAPVSVTYMSEVRLRIGNPSVPAIPSSDPPQNSARKSAAPSDSAVSMESCPYMSRARAARVQCSSSFSLENARLRRSPNSGPCGSGRSGNSRDSVRSTPALMSWRR